MLISSLLGVGVGTVAGASRGVVRTGLLGATDFALALPRVVLLLLLASLWQPSAVLVVVVLGVTGWMSVARLVFDTILEAGAWLGPNVVLTNATYPRSRGVKESLHGPLIREGAKIGANATLLPGLTIGRDALVGAGAVVVADVPEGVVVAGNPAGILRRVDEIEAYRAREGGP